MSQTSAERRARGLRRLEVWLPADYVRKLDAISDASGYSRAEIIESMIDGETQEWEQIRERQTKKKPRERRGSRG
jgi:metal-responsive CopG/Arc/MetJ family transcriptional regulator